MGQIPRQGGQCLCTTPRRGPRRRSARRAYPPATATRGGTDEDQRAQPAPGQDHRHHLRRGDRQRGARRGRQPPRGLDHGRGGQGARARRGRGGHRGDQGLRRDAGRRLSALARGSRPTGFVPALLPPPGDGTPSLWLVVDADGRLLVEGGGDAVRLPRAERAPLVAEDTVHLGALDGVPCVAIGVAGTPDAPPGLAFVAARGLVPRLDDDALGLVARALMLVEWQRTSRFCGRCGTPTEPLPGERARRCPRCGLLAYPRLAPVAIVRVTRGDRLLLARGERFPPGFFSILAGFVD